MSAETTARKPSANKNIKKLRAISMVCGLTRSWQQWVSDNEEKQASEPSGWAPGCPEDPNDAIKEAAKNRLSQKSQTPTKSEGDGEAPGESRIRTTQVIKTVTRDVQERSAGIEFLTKRICKDPATDELDKMLSKKGSPTRRRKCSNMVSELMQGWKEIEKEKTQDKESADNEFAEDERDQKLGTNQDNNETNEQTESSSVRIKRSTVLG